MVIASRQASSQAQILKSKLTLLSTKKPRMAESSYSAVSFSKLTRVAFCSAKVRAFAERKTTILTDFHLDPRRKRLSRQQNAKAEVDTGYVKSNRSRHASVGLDTNRFTVRWCVNDKFSK